MDVLIFLVTTFAILLLFFLLTGFLRNRSRQKRTEEGVLLSISVPLNSEIWPDAAEQLYNELYGLFEKDWRRFFTGQPVVSFEIVAIQEAVGFYLYIPYKIRDMVENAIYAQYPNAIIDDADFYDLFAQDCKATFTELVKAKHPAYPLRTYRDTFEEGGFGQMEDVSSDFLNAVTNAMVNLNEGEAIVAQLLIRPTGTRWQKKGDKFARKIYRKTISVGSKIGHKLTPVEEKMQRDIYQSVGKVGFESALRIVSTAKTKKRAEQLRDTVIAAYAALAYEGSNKLIRKTPIAKSKAFELFMYRYFPLFTHQGTWDVPFVHKTTIFNSEELATIFHMPSKKVLTPNLSMVRAKRAPVPGEAATTGRYADSVVVGYNYYRGIKTPVGVKKDDRRRHIYCIGKTGMGKSVLATNMIYQDIMRGDGCCFIDPHGDSIEAILKFIPEHRIKDVVLFDASDMAFPIGLNLLEYETIEQKDFIVNEFINILYKLFAQFMDPMFEHIARNCLMTIADNPQGGTLVEMTRILTDETFRNYLIEHIKNPVNKIFWEEEMGQTVEFHMSEILGPVLSKFGRFVSNEMMRNIIGQSKSGINLRKVMDNQQILLINLTKGKVGEINCQLLGMIFITKILMSALSRVNIDEADRKDFYLYVDEFQNFASDTFTTILSEARKYRLNLYITHQYLGQLTTQKKASVIAKQDEKERDQERSEKEMHEAVFGNVGTMMFMRVGAPDAEVIARELKPTFEETDVINTDKYMLYTKLLVDGVATNPFSVHTYPPPNVTTDYSEAIRDFSRRTYGRPRSEVEAEIFERGMFDKLGTGENKIANDDFAGGGEMSGAM